MKDIVIDGVNLTELKKRFDEVNKEIADTRQSIRQGAAKYIADNIQQGKKLIDEMLGEDDDAKSKEEVDSLATQAHELLSEAYFVSEVSGVSFDLPYYDRQSEYYPDGGTYTSQIDESENEALEDNEAVSKLYGLLEDMESEVSDWNTSYC